MAQRDGEIENLAHAYRVMDVRWDASPRVIKASYRKLVKRWHPDRHTPGTPGHTEATLMTKLLNEAFARVQNGPLRNSFAEVSSADGVRASGSRRDARDQASDEPDPSGASRSEYMPRDPVEDATEYYRVMENARKAGARDDAARPFDWLGFAVRFVIGALFGGLLSFRVIIGLWQRPKLVPVGIVVTILFCALASGFGGDTAWRAIRPGGLWWWRRWD
jgi:curved DNA-binding protein CbpA